ncbi:hypothetical protein APHAL10511_006597 [Amanita phalloides]|nr:hypothetical protein APHAL10511_006597 [Amanita phalloides]
MANPGSQVPLLLGNNDQADSTSANLIEQEEIEFHGGNHQAPSPSPADSPQAQATPDLSHIDSSPNDNQQLNVSQGPWTPQNCMQNGNIPTLDPHLMEMFQAFQAQYSPIAPTGPTPNGFSPNGFSPNGFSPNSFSPIGLAPNGFSPNSLTPNGLPPSSSNGPGLGLGSAVQLTSKKRKKVPSSDRSTRSKKSQVCE